MKYRIDFKIRLLTFKVIHGLAPSYLTSLIAVKTNAYNLRSSNDCLLNMPKKITKKALDDRAFQVAAPGLWNKLPASLRNIDCLQDFKRYLKTHFFNKLLVFRSYSHIFRFIVL